MRHTASDTDLAAAAAQGDRTAFSVLLDRHYDVMFRLCFRLTGRKDVAEDLVQDICLVLPQKLSQFRGDARVTTWLHRIAVNAVHDWRRRSATRARAAEGWGDWELNRRAVAEDQAEQLDWLSQAMAQLPEDLRDTLALTLGDELTQAEAAEVLGVSEGTVAWRMSDVRKRLKAMRKEDTDQ